MSERIYSVGLIGCGRVAWLLDQDRLIPNKPVTHMGAYVRVDRTRVIAAADVRIDHLQAFSKEFGVEKAYLDYEEMLAREELDIVSICAYAHDRYRMVVDAVNAGVKGIWCEKAFATSLEEAEAMVALCEEQGVTLIVGHTRRWSPDYQHARRLLKDGAIGKPLSVVCHFSGSMVHTGTHAFDVLRFFFGEARWVEARLEPQREKQPDDIHHAKRLVQYDVGGYALVTFENGVYATVHGDSKEYFLFEFDIMGTEGRLRIGNWLFELFEAEMSEREQGLRELHSKDTGAWQEENPFVAAVHHLIDCMEGRSENVSSPRDGMAALEMALAIQESHLNGGSRVYLPLQTRSLRVISR
ncbi:MAG TPA: Gfo/Idh/MocA family oxidoreductase [Syntrophorhabdales bacterium]|nr:Gfo/Idh/MocA family oxidoreductase [Syntrophorhabdales bacterium]